MLKILLAPLLFPLALAASAADNGVIRTQTCTPSNLFVLDASLSSLVMRELSADPGQGLEAFKYLNGRLNRRIRLAVAYEQRGEFPKMAYFLPSPHLSWAEFSPDDGSILLSHEVLHLGKDNEEILIEDRARLEQVVRQIAGSIVHETSHARDDLQEGGDIKSLETELIAFYREMFYELDSAERAAQLPVWVECARRERQREALGQAVDLFKAAHKGQPLPPDLMASSTEYNEAVHRLSDLAFHKTDLLLRFDRGNAAFEAELAKGYEERSLICTDAGAAEERARSARRLAVFEGGATKLRDLCARGLGGTCLQDAADADLQAYREKKRLAGLSDARTRARLCDYYGNLLKQLRDEADQRRLSRRVLGPLEAASKGEPQ